MAGGETLCKPRLVGGRTPSYQAWRCTAVCGETIVAGYIRPLWRAAATVVAWLLPYRKGVGAASLNKQLGTRWQNLTNVN